MIKTINLQKDYGDLKVLKGISTDIKQGEIVAVIGPSGSGKSTFLRCLNLMEQPTGGEVFFKGKKKKKKMLKTFLVAKSFFCHCPIYCFYKILDIGFAVVVVF